MRTPTNTNNGRTEASRREEIIFGEPIDWDIREDLHQIAFFDWNHEAVDWLNGPLLGLDQLETLLREGLIDGRAGHNRSPTADEFRRLGAMLEEWDLRVGFNGYVITPEREDCRVTITGFHITSRTPIPEPVVNMLTAAYDQFDQADEFEHYQDDDGVHHLTTWWD